jgi:hypothetical protein
MSAGQPSANRGVSQSSAPSAASNNRSQGPTGGLGSNASPSASYSTPNAPQAPSKPSEGSKKPSGPASPMAGQGPSYASPASAMAGNKYQSLKNQLDAAGRGLQGISNTPNPSRGITTPTRDPGNPGRGTTVPSRDPTLGNPSRGVTQPTMAPSYPGRGVTIPSRDPTAGNPSRGMTPPTTPDSYPGRGITPPSKDPRTGNPSRGKTVPTAAPMANPGRGVTVPTTPPSYPGRGITPPTAPPGTDPYSYPWTAPNGSYAGPKVGPGGRLNKKARDAWDTNPYVAPNGSYYGPKAGPGGKLSHDARFADAHRKGYVSPGVAREPNDAEMMGRMMDAESNIIKNPMGGVLTEAWQGVGDVVRNRMLSDKFPDTVSDVLSQRQQFSPMTAKGSGNIKNYPARESATMVADSILSGETAPVVGNSLNYGNLDTIRNKPNYSSQATKNAFNAIDPVKTYYDAKNPDTFQHTFGTIGPSDVNLDMAPAGYNPASYSPPTPAARSVPQSNVPKALGSIAASAGNMLAAPGIGLGKLAGSIPTAGDVKSFTNSLPSQKSIGVANFADKYLGTNVVGDAISGGIRSGLNAAGRGVSNMMGNIAGGIVAAPETISNLGSTPPSYNEGSGRMPTSGEVASANKSASSTSTKSSSSKSSSENNSSRARKRIVQQLMAGEPVPVPIPVPPGEPPQFGYKQLSDAEREAALRQLLGEGW